MGLFKVFIEPISINIFGWTIFTKKFLIKFFLVGLGLLYSMNYNFM